MLKKVKTVSMLLCLMAAYSSTTKATISPAKANLKAVEQQTETCKGVVKDAMGETVIGASVVVKGTTNGTITGIDGDFTLTGVPQGSVIVISYVGYITQEVKFTGQPIKVVLKENSKTLDEVVVVGYGVQKKANLTGSVATVSAKTLESRPVSSISSAIAGQMPGVTAIQSSGAPGSQTASITVRGKNSINAASPLVIVDGVPGSMNMLDPNDIETFTVLKDAASAAIYGVQAANGVILITTKQGKKGEKTRVNYSGNVSWSSPVAKRELVNAYEYATLFNEATLNENPNDAVMFTPEDIEGYRTGALPSTDWYNESIKKSAIETMHNIAINGGTEKTTYNASLGYTYQDGLTKDNDYSRYNARMNLNSEINKYIRVGVNASGYRAVSKDAWNSFVNVFQGVTREKPTNSIYNEDGSFAYHGVDNPLAIQGDKSGWRRNTQQELNLTAHATLQLLPELSIKGVYSVRNYTNNQDGFKKHFSYGNDKSHYDSGLREGYDKYYNNNYYTGQVLINFNKSFGKHNLAALAGFESYEHIYKYTEASRQGGGNDELTESLNTLDQSSQKNKDGGYEMARLSYFGRVQYDYAGKYLFEANLRSDASSRFPKHNRWGVFPAFSAGWRISEEAFIKDNISWLSNLKLRVGYGKTGNEELASDDIYPAIPTYTYNSADNATKFLFGNQLYSTVYEARYANTNLTWATVTNYEVGLEAGFLNNMINMELSAYRKKTNDMLLYMPIQGVIGMAAPAQNVGSVKNTGFDFLINHNKQINRDWSYSVSLNVSYVKNEIVDMAGTEGRTDNDKIWNLEGYPIGSYYGFVADGFFNTEEDLRNCPKRLPNGVEKMGDIKYKDLNHDGKITEDGDRMVIGKNFPSWTGGLNLNVAYKNIDLSMLFQGAFDVDGYYTGEAAYAFYNGATALKRHLDRWTPEHHNASYPRLTRSSQTNFVTSSFWLQDASYVRLKNITLGYTLPKAWLDKAGISNAKIFFTGENLLTFTGLDGGIDPEESDERGWSYGNVKKLSLGVKLSF